ncbi:hypothetical protein [Gimesia fumaroli]|uniref:Uncharacterized protein n=1 Tax=Gimesia fumaroli TaxID=2527976 RepID=A0A518ICS2_9PLAN|nr:hypothetical protein [Gimesia fumaroli]QDV50839.1 hypothetical protein Enr17x_28840 [Gimesia fumaroli]
MMSIYPDPEESKLRDSICLLIVLIIAFVLLLFTLPGCQADQRTYQPFVEPPAPAERPVEKIRPAIHDAAVRVDEVLEKTPMPAVAEVLADDALDMIEKVDPLPKPAAPDPRAAEIIEPELEPVIIPDEDQSEQTESDIGTWIIVCFALIVLIYVSFQMLKGFKDDVKDSERNGSTS